MNKKRCAVAALLLVVSVSSALFAAPSIEKLSKKGRYNVALSVVWEGNTYAVQSREEYYAEVERQKKAGRIANAYYVSADFSAEKQVSDLEDLFTRDIDILILQAVNPPAVSEIIKKFHDKGTIVIPCVSPLVTDQYMASLMAYDEDFGAAGAQFLVDKLKGKGNIIALDGMDGITVAINRWAGAKKVFDKYPGIKVLAKPFADWDYAKGKAATENLLSAFPKIDGVWSSGGDMTRGAIEAFVEAKRQLVPMMGEDANGFLKAWKKYESAPGFDAIACSMPTYFFADALVLGLDVAQGKKTVGKDFPKDQVVKVYEIRKANLDKFVRLDLSDSFWANTKMEESLLQKLFGVKK